jgi:hypothetical protein
MGPQITDASLNDLMVMTNLKSLHLENTGVTEAGLEKLWEAMPETQITTSP